MKDGHLKTSNTINDFEVKSINLTLRKNKEKLEWIDTCIPIHSSFFIGLTFCFSQVPQVYSQTIQSEHLAISFTLTDFQ